MPVAVAYVRQRCSNILKVIENFNIIVLFNKVPHMRFARTVKNAFTIGEVSNITGLKPAMLNFLIRQQYLNPTYREDHDLPLRKKRQPRGNTRYCSYRDLMIAKTIQRLLEAGVQLVRVKEALQSLRADEHWLTTKGITADRAVSWLVTDGKQVYLRDDKGFVQLVGKGHQRVFSFIIEMTSVRSEIQAGIQVWCPEKIAYFRFANAAPLFDPPRSSSAASRPPVRRGR